MTNPILPENIASGQTGALVNWQELNEFHNEYLKQSGARYVPADFADVDDVTSRPLVTIPASGSARTLDFGAGVAPTYLVTLNANCAFTFANFGTASRAVTMDLYLLGLSGRTPSFPAGVTWGTIGEPAWPVSASWVHIRFTTVDAGVNIYAEASVQGLTITGGGGGSITPTGAWNSGTTYAVNDSVSYLGSSYLSRVNSNTNHQPDISTTQWQVLAAAGAAGAVLAEFTDLGNISGGSNTLTGADNTQVRYKATLTGTTTVTIDLDPNQALTLVAVQDTTGGRTLTHSGVVTWLTDNRSAPTPTKLASEVEVYSYWADGAGVIYGEWKTDPKIVQNTVRWNTPGDLSTGTGTAVEIINQDWKIVAVRAYANTAPTGASLIVDVNKNGTTIFTTQANRPTITAGNKDSGSVTNMDVTTLAAGDRLTVDIDQRGSTIHGSDLTVSVTLATAVNPRVGGLSIATISTTSYTLQPIDAQRTLHFTNASGCTVTLPSTSTFTIGEDAINFRGLGGPVTLSPQAPAVLDLPPQFQHVKYVRYVIEPIATNEWVVS